MSDLEVFPISLPGGINQSAPEPTEEDLEELQNFAIFRNRVGLRAPLSLIATVQDDQGTPADVDAILDITDHEGKMWCASWSSSQQDVYLHSMQVDGSALTLEAVVWTTVVSKPTVKLVSFEGGTAASGTSRLYISDYDQNLVTRYWDGATMNDLAVDFDADSSAEDVYFSLMIPYKFHLWGTGFYEAAEDRLEMARFSQPGLVPGTDPAGGSNPREWFTADHRSVGRRGDKIVAVGRAGDRLLLFQKRAIHAIYGSGADTWTRQELSNVIGCVGPHALATADERVCYFWASDGPYRTDGNSIEYLGLPIRQIAVESDAAERSTHVGYSPDDGVVHFLVSPAGEDSYHYDLKFDTRRNRWMRSEWTASNAPAVEDSYDISNFSTSLSTAPGVGQITGLAQSWQSSGSPGPVTGVKVYLGKRLSPTGTLTAKIYAHSGVYGTSSLPDTGTLLATGETKTTAEITNSVSSPGEYTFDFDGDWTPSATTNYVFVLEYSGTSDASNYISWASDNTAPSHGGNAARRDNGVWSAFSSFDQIFEVVSLSGDPVKAEFGAMAFLDAASAPAPAGAPSLLGTTATSDTEMDVSWINGDTNVDTVTHIYRSTSSGFTPNDSTNRIATVASGVSAYGDSGLTGDTTYYYKARHFRNSQHSSESSQATDTTWLTEPTGVGLSGLTDGLTVSGTNNASGADIVIQRKTLGGTYSTVQTLSNPGASFSWDDTGLSVGTTYYYRCKATLGGSTDSEWSAEVSRAAGLATTAPAAPSGFSATAAGETQIDLAWTDNSDNEDGFEVWRSTDGGSNYSLRASVAANSTSYSDTSLTSNTEYYYRVRAVNAAGESSYAAADNATTDPNLDTPSDLAAVAAGTSQIDLTWTDGAGDETAWQVHQSDVGSGGPYALVATLSSNSSSHSAVGLSADTQYWYKVRPMFGATAGTFSNVATASTVGTPPAAPTGLTATKNGGSPNDTIDLAWTDNASGEDNYEVHRSSVASSGPFNLIATIAADSTSHQDTGLTPGTEYWYRVRATDAVTGNSAFSNVDSDTTDGTPTVPADPTSLVATPDDSDLNGTEVSAVDLTWTDNADNEDEYVLERCQGASCTSWAVIATLPPDTESYRDTGVTDQHTAGTTYRYRLKASNAGGDSNYITTGDIIVEPQVTATLIGQETSFCIDAGEGVSIATLQITLTITNGGDITGLEQRTIQVNVNEEQDLFGNPIWQNLYSDATAFTSLVHGEFGDVGQLVEGYNYKYRVSDYYGTTGENTGTFNSTPTGLIPVVGVDCS